MLLVDDAIWPWRGRRWAHLVSDSDLDELHDLAHRIGLPYVAFQGDHYDVHEELRTRAVELGAVPTPARDLVRALRVAGLRRRGPLPPWQWVERRGGRSTSLAAVAERATADLDLDLAGVLDRAGDTAVHGPFDEVGWARRGPETLVLASSAEVRPVPAGLERPGPGLALHRSSGERGTYVELVVSGAPT